jgi:hypothetical protein
MRGRNTGRRRDGTERVVSGLSDNRCNTFGCENPALHSKKYTINLQIT